MAADKISDTGEGTIKKAAKELERFQKLTVLVGYQPSGGTELAVIDIATFQEFGTANIPARPFLSSAMDTNQAKIAEAIQQVVTDIIDGKFTAVQGASRLGVFAQTLVKQRIADSPSWAEPLAQSTIDAKGSDKPLVDTAEMLNSVTWTVNENDSVIASG